MKQEIYISIDIEADGPVPGLNSLLSFGAAAFDLKAEDPRAPIATFEANLYTLDNGNWPRAHQNAATMKWWKTQPEAWKACHTNRRLPEEAMPEFIQWVRDLPGKPVIVGFPVTFDFMFLQWYAQVFHAPGVTPNWGFQGLDIKTLMATKLGIPFKQATKGRVSKLRPDWFEGLPKHNHQALTDALGQGILFVNIMLLGETAS